jgi:lipopolysaccharide export system protein LptA
MPRIRVINSLCFVFIMIYCASTAFAGDRPQEKDPGTGSEQIEIEADQLISHSEEKYAEFSGNVRARQGPVAITSERLRIYYQSDPQSANSQAGQQESIKQVVAIGNVHFVTDKYSAKAERVEYDLEKQVIVLIGDNSTLVDSKNSLTGSKITIDRKSGQMKVESHSQKRVKAIFHPDQSKKKEE